MSSQITHRKLFGFIPLPLFLGYALAADQVGTVTTSTTALQEEGAALLAAWYAATDGMGAVIDKYHGPLVGSQEARRLSDADIEVRVVAMETAGTVLRQTVSALYWFVREIHSLEEHPTEPHSVAVAGHMIVIGHDHRTIITPIGRSVTL